MAGPHEAGLRSRGTRIARPCLPLFVVSPHGPGGCATTTPAHLSLILSRQLSSRLLRAHVSSRDVLCRLSVLRLSPARGAVGEANRQGDMVQADEDRCSPLPLGCRLSRVDDSLRTELGTYVFFWLRGGVPVGHGGFANASAETRRHGYQSDQLADGRTHPERGAGGKGAERGDGGPIQARSGHRGAIGRQAGADGPHSGHASLPFLPAGPSAR